MAVDLKHTNERVDILTNCSNNLRHAASLCLEVQRYHDSTSDYTNRAANVNARMAVIQSLISAIANELSELASNDNMAFQFEWVAGRNGIEDIYVSSSSNQVILRYEGGAQITSAFVNALSVTDVIRVEGSTYTSQHMVVSALNAGFSAIQPVGTPIGGNESLLSRVIKELKG